MRTPPLLLGAALVFWGWQSATLALAVPLALLAEGWRLTPMRWELSEEDFQRLSDFTSVLFVVLVFYQFNEHVLAGIFHVLKWLPPALMLLLLGQLYSRRGTVPLSALFASMRRAEGSVLASVRRDIDLSYPYFIICLAAASAGEPRSVSFLATTAALLAWGLWPWRPRRYHPALWGTVLAAALSVGFLLQHGLQSAQGAVGSWVVDWLRDQSIGGVSPDRAFTAIGMVGRLKLSERVRLRVRTERPLRGSLLLREASYGEYRYGTWRNGKTALVPIERHPGEAGWPLALPVGRGERVTVIAPLNSDVDVIPLPHGARVLRSPTILAVQRHPYGTVMVDAKPGYLEYEVEFDAGALSEPPPGPADLEVPAEYAGIFTALRTELPSRSDSSRARVAAVEEFFRGNFTYSLAQHRPPWRHPMRDFLQRSRSGHCEYFATATVLLLRQLGIPARYAVGYSVSEWSVLEGQYVARERDAHAWTLAYLEGAWRIVDTTPAVWREAEDAAANPFSTVLDFTAWAGYHWARMRSGEQAWRHQLPWLLAPLTVWLIWRLRNTRRATAAASAPSMTFREPMLGADSEFYLLLARMTRRNEGPLAGETLKAWIRRLGPHREAQHLRWLLDLHYRYRFDPHGLDGHRREALRAAACLNAPSGFNPEGDSDLRAGRRQDRGQPEP